MLTPSFVFLSLSFFLFTLPPLSFPLFLSPTHPPSFSPLGLSSFFPYYYSGADWEVISFSVVTSGSVNLDRSDSRIFTDFSLSGRIFTVTTEKEISVFTLPIFVSTARNLSGQGPSHLCDTEYPMGSKPELKISFPMKIIFPPIKSQNSSFERKNNLTDLNFSAAIVVSTTVTSVGIESNISNNTDYGSEPSEKAGTNTAKKINLKSRKSISSALPLNSNGSTVATVEKFSLKIQFAIFHRISAQWMTVEGFLSCEKNKSEKKVDENIEHFLNFVDMKKDLEITDLKKWKLSGAVTAFCFNEKRSIVALGLDDGTACIFCTLTFLNA